jgi:hypothetical protein
MGMKAPGGKQPQAKSTPSEGVMRVSVRRLGKTSR